MRKIDKLSVVWSAVYSFQNSIITTQKVLAVTYRFFSEKLAELTKSMAYTPNFNGIEMELIEIINNLIEIKSGSKWFAGENPGIADIEIYSILSVLDEQKLARGTVRHFKKYAINIGSFEAHLIILSCRAMNIMHIFE